jgi:hypothetical protein
MTVVALGPKGKRVDIPQSWLDDFDKGVINRGGLLDYAIRTQQGIPSDFGLEDAPKPEVSGAFNAAMIGGGRQLDTLSANIGQATGDLGAYLGNEKDREFSAAQREREAEINRLAEPVREQFPKASFAGEMLPGFAVPGGRVAQIGAGAGLGALQGDNAQERLIGAGIGGGAAYAGQKLGDYASRTLMPKLQGFFGSRLAGARQVLNQADIPLTLGERGSPAARFIDVLKSTLTRSKPLHGQQLTALTRAAAETLGEQADDLSKPVLGAAANRIGSVYEGVAREVGDIAIGDDIAARLLQVDDMMKTVPEPTKAIGAIQLVEDAITNPAKQFTGEAYNAIRQRLGRISTQLWNQGSGLEAEVVDELINTLDDALAKSAPEAAERLASVRPQWQFLRALRRGAAIDPNGMINPQAMNQSMEATYKGFDIGKMGQGAAANFGRTLDAFNQVIRPFKSSGTTERLAGVAAPVVAGLGLTGMAGPMAGPLATLAVLLSGGGAGGAAGGNASREAALKLSQLLQQQQGQ